MADPTKAEIMLDQVTKINALIRRFQLCKDHPIPPASLGFVAFHQIHHKSLSRECPRPYRSAYRPEGNGFGPCGADTGWRSADRFEVALWPFGQLYKENALDGYTTPDEL